MNTEITYLYRDASNNKVWNKEVVEGEMTEDMKNKIMSSCVNPMPDISQFVPEMVGLPLERFSDMNEDDTDFAELFFDGFESTDANPTVKDIVTQDILTAEKLVSNFKAASKAKWNTNAMRDWLL